MSNPIATSARWGCSGMLLGAAAGTLALLPLRPQSTTGYEELAWILMTMALGALLGGAVGLLRGLRGEPHRGLTVAAYLPLAVLLATFSAGVAALLAPPLARWLVELTARRRPALLSRG